jgi:hypothetical protein
MRGAFAAGWSRQELPTLAAAVVRRTPVALLPKRLRVIGPTASSDGWRVRASCSRQTRQRLRAELAWRLVGSACAWSSRVRVLSG